MLRAEVALLAPDVSPFAMLVNEWGDAVLSAEIREPGSGTVYATAGTVVVGSLPLSPEQRDALSRWQAPGLA